MEKVELNNLGKTTKILRYKTLEGYRQIIIDTISYCRSCTSKSMTFIFAGNLDYPPVCETISVVEGILDENFFIRCHRSFLININKVDYFTSSKRIIFMQNGEQIPVSKSRWIEIKVKLLENQISDKKMKRVDS